MAEETRRDWEVIQENLTAEGGLADRTERLKVRNGWLYRVITGDGGVAVAFVPGE